jgi:glyoxylase-like metal-dependent hydrolase (beta-lactamase superfamily II)
MGVNIYPIKLGFDHCYIIRGEKTILIDGGSPNQVNQFKKGLARLSIEPEEIELIIITHGHWDHIASAKEIKTITGAKIIMHKAEKELLEKGLKPMPPGISNWGHIMKRLITMFLPLVSIPATTVDITIGDEGLPLDAYRIPGRIIYTPGHSFGSVSVLLETGEAFVGDMAMNALPLRFGPGLPIFAEDLARLKQSWRLLLDQGAKTIYPAHGEPFSADIIRKAIS